MMHLLVVTNEIVYTTSGQLTVSVRSAVRDCSLPSFSELEKTDEMVPSVDFDGRVWRAPLARGWI